MKLNQNIFGRNFTNSLMIMWKTKICDIFKAAYENLQLVT